MKTNFEGKINDVKYNDIVSYNERIKELTQNGLPFTASIEMHSTNDDVNLFPHGEVQMGPDGILHTNIDFIDKYNKLTTGALHNKLADMFVPIIDAMQSMPEEDLNDYINKLNALGGWFEHCRTQNKEAIDSAKHRLEYSRKNRESLNKQLAHIQQVIRQAEDEEERLTKNLAYLNKSDLTIEEWCRAYENVSHHAIDEISTRQTKQNEPEEMEEDDVEKIPMAIRDLWEYIFGN